MEDKVKDLLERIRGTASVAADATVDAARVAGKRAGQMVDVAKLNVQLFDMNGEFNDLMRQLGQVMYSAHKGEEQEGDCVTDLLLKADEAEAKIAELKTRIADLRRAKNCPSCGAACGKDAKFCPNCGQAL